MEGALSQDRSEKIFSYIAVLGDVNDQLVISLKKCVELLVQFKDFVPDPAGWQEMLDVFEATIGVGQRVVEEKTLH